MLLRYVGAIALVLVAILSAISSGCAPAIGERPLSSTPVAQSAILISGSGSALPVVQKLAEAYRLADPKTRIGFEEGTNTGGAIRGVIEGTLDIAVANRRLSDYEAGQGLKEYPFARDAVAFAAHRPVPTKGLSTSQVRDIFGGGITNWLQLYMSPGEILVLDRDEDESARKEILLPLMSGRPVNARTIVLTSASDMVGALESTEDAVGYTPLGLVRINRPSSVQVLDLDGVVPGAKSVGNGTYPWYLTFSLIGRSDAPRSVRRFIDFVTGPEGGRVVEGYGYAAASP